MNYKKLEKEDYEEPCCPFIKPDDIKRVDIRRVIEKLDFFLNRRDYDCAISHLEIWLKEAKTIKDMNAVLSILNEQIGIYRKVSDKEKCFKAAESAVLLSENEGLCDTVFYATTLINAATGFKSFGENEKALELYKKAKIIYEEKLLKTDERFGGLYNNMAIALSDSQEYEEAERLFFKAISVMKSQKSHEGEMAVTYCNLADLESKKHGLETGEKMINEYLVEAEKLLNSKTLARDGNYAFVCEKCSGVFDYYGYFAFGRELKKRADEIYERN